MILNQNIGSKKSVSVGRISDHGRTATNLIQGGMQASRACFHGSMNVLQTCRAYWSHAKDTKWLNEHSLGAQPRIRLRQPWEGPRNS